VDLERLFDGWQAAWSGRDASAFASLCAPDVHYEDPLTSEPLEGLGQLVGHVKDEHRQAAELPMALLGEVQGPAGLGEACGRCRR